MPFVGQQGGSSYPTIRRVDLISGEQWLREGRGYRPPSPAGAAGIGVSRTPGAASPRAAFSPAEGNWLHEMVRAPLNVWEHGGVVQLSSVNRYGFTSRSEMLYPELYKPIDTKFWQPLTREERCELVARAAAANARAPSQAAQLRRAQKGRGAAAQGDAGAPVQRPGGAVLQGQQRDRQDRAARHADPRLRSTSVR
ncbi:MAG: hypothetical protein M3R04_02220 [bacterium]|nr:hypothetical protein [bacterium]